MTLIPQINPLTGLPYGMVREDFQQVDVIPRFDEKEGKLTEWTNQLRRIQFSLDDLRETSFKEFSIDDIAKIQIELQKISLRANGLNTFMESLR